MKRVLYAAVSAIMVLVFCSCSMANANDSASMNAKMGYVNIQGNTSGVEVYINGVAKTVVFDKTTHAATLLLPPGSYQIKVRRNGLDLVNERISVAVSNTTQVIVP